MTGVIAMEHEYPEDETDLTSDQFDKLADGGEPVALVARASATRMVLTNGGAPSLGAIYLFKPGAANTSGAANRGQAPVEQSA